MITFLSDMLCEQCVVIIARLLILSDGSDTRADKYSDCFIDLVYLCGGFTNLTNQALEEQNARI